MEEMLDVLNQFGEFTGQTATRKACHQEGLWHRGIVVNIVKPDKSQILLQKRSQTKKLWPGLWDMAIGGHVAAGEFSYQAALREAEEEIGLKFNPENLLFIGSTISENQVPGIINRHFNDFFVLYADLDASKLTLQPEEVEAISWIDLEDFQSRVINNFEGLTDKASCWDYLLKFLRNANSQQRSSRS